MKWQMIEFTEEIVLTGDSDWRKDGKGGYEYLQGNHYNDKDHLIYTG